ncbi:hypothetical protein F4V43_02345 [Paenibacillus spiritus]|uniref:Helix-turn-helix transcriptional regulator n=1 Tax=Paenibacillus spiritus TaxID=2496557 RepID=A0A5J5GGK8_9BACL|nr:hypothetical protein [Paenibacillus spiritus]KAA9007346.1 hypothetical protein F4V43_02345 [Paenibacillus spiritus]
MHLGNYISDIIKEKGFIKAWVAEKANIKYKTFLDKIATDRFTGKELLRIAKVLGIELDELKHNYEWR